MSSILISGRRKSTAAIRASLRELGLQLSLLNHRVSARLELRGADLECLDVLSRLGPLGPGALARTVGLHPATMTGVLDRLERAGWVVRERDPSDRRGVVVRAVRERGAELAGMYAGMNASMTKLCAGYDETELAVIADFLAKTTTAGRAATDDLADD
jgi:DNA-binding MarR family transcriptional regulator